LKGVIMVESTREIGDKIERETRFYITSLVLLASQLGPIIRSHWAIENNLHWTLDTIFNEDQSRLRKGHGAKNMAIVRHFAVNLLRRAADKRSIKRRRKRAAWDPEYMLQILQPRPC
jgi:predicted transposase YbfD/YdcC